MHVWRCSCQRERCLHGRECGRRSCAVLTSGLGRSRRHSHPAVPADHPEWHHRGGGQAAPGLQREPCGLLGAGGEAGSRQCALPFPLALAPFGLCRGCMQNVWQGHWWLQACVPLVLPLRACGTAGAGRCMPRIFPPISDRVCRRSLSPACWASGPSWASWACTGAPGIQPSAELATLSCPAMLTWCHARHLTTNEPSLCCLQWYDPGPLCADCLLPGNHPAAALGPGGGCSTAAGRAGSGRIVTCAAFKFLFPTHALPAFAQNLLNHPLPYMSVHFVLCWLLPALVAGTVFVLLHVKTLSKTLSRMVRALALRLRMSRCHASAALVLPLCSTGLTSICGQRRCDVWKTGVNRTSGAVRQATW